jgi:hypothetical protein
MKVDAMKEVVIKVPEPKFEFFMELMDQLGLEVTQRYEVPEEHISIVSERIEQSSKDPSRLKNWDDVKDTFRDSK